MTTLQIRLKHCIQTILELEPELRENAVGKCFEAEFSTLRTCLQRIGALPLGEDDVQRLETATASFLAELKFSGQSVPRKGRLLQ